MNGRSRATVVDRDHIRDQVYGRANNDESSTKYWTSVGMALLAQKRKGVRLLVKDQKLDFRSIDSQSDLGEITALLDAAEELLQKQIFSNGQGRYSTNNRSTDITDVIGYGGYMNRPIIDNHSDLYLKVRKNVSNAFEERQDEWFEFLQEEHHCMMYTKRSSLEHLKEDVLTAKIFFRSLILEEIGLFQKVSFVLFHSFQTMS